MILLSSRKDPAIAKGPNFPRIVTGMVPNSRSSSFKYLAAGRGVRHLCEGDRRFVQTERWL